MGNFKVRIAPSPTGDPHVGTLYIALFDYVFAKANNGKFVLRIEDTDQKRLCKESEKQIFDTLKWFGLTWDEGPDVGGENGPYRQSERFEIYKKYSQILVDKGFAYYCFCDTNRLNTLRERQNAMKKPTGYDGHCRSLSKEEIKEKLDSNTLHVIRLKVPYEGQTIVNDILRGQVIFDNDKIDDQVLLKSDGYPTYHLANVVDDYLMKITHVIRAEEWIASTPKHIILYKAFGWPEPIWCHMPLLRNNDKSKISKRKNHVSLLHYINEGYLKEAMINFLALMGYSMGSEREIFSLEEMINEFSFDKISLGGPIFNVEKLNWLNNIYLRKKDLKDLAKLAFPYYKESGFFKEKSFEDIDLDNFCQILNIARESSNTLKQLPEKSDVFLIDKYELPKINDDMNSKERKNIQKMYNVLGDDFSKKVVSEFFKNFKNFATTLTEENAKRILLDIKDKYDESFSKVFMPIRILLTGKNKGPDLASIIAIVGKERILKRIEMFNELYDVIL